MSLTHRPADSSSAASIPTERAASHSPPNERVHININTPTSMPTTSVPIHRRRSSPLPHPPSDKEVDVATKIQTTWRTHHSQRTALQTITELQAKFDALKAEFVLPSSLDFIALGSTTHEHVPLSTAGVSLDLTDVVGEDDVAHVPRLAYTPTNAPLHAYYEELSRILTRLDGVQSGGHEEVRTRRRELARKVEHKAERVERNKRAEAPRTFGSCLGLQSQRSEWYRVYRVRSRPLKQIYRCYSPQLNTGLLPSI